MGNKLKSFALQWKPVDIFLLFLSVFAILFINYFPLLYVYLTTPMGMVFLGQASFFAPVDTNLYVSAIHYGQWGGILLPNLYTSLPNRPIFIYTLLTTIGFLFKSVNPFLLFTVFGLIAAVILIIGLVFLIKKLGFSIKMSLFSTFLICLGGGFGFINFSGVISADMTDVHPTFLNTLQKPHEAIAVLSYIFALVYMYLFVVKKKKVKIKTILSVVIPLVIFTFIYPFFVVTFLLITGMFLFVCKKKHIMKQDVLFFLLLLFSSGILTGLMYSQLVSNPTFAGISTNISGSILSVLLGFGILIPLFIFQLFWLPRSALKTFLSIWFAITFFLAILPIGPGAVFFRGSFFPIVLLSILVLEKIRDKTRLVIGFGLFFCFFTFLIATSMHIFYLRMTYNYQQNPYVYVPRQQYEIFSYLTNHTPSKSSILSLYILGNQIPAFTRNVVYLGHGWQTPDAASKLKEEQQFYLGEDNLDQARQFLLGNNISYVVWGLEEQWFYQTYAKKENNLPKVFSELTLVYKQDGIAIFSVNRNKLDK